MTPSTRKMRRTREAAASNDAPLSAYELYDVQGDSASALSSYATGDKDSTPTLSSKYNSLLLSHVSPKTSVAEKSIETLLERMKEFDSEFQAKSKDQLLSARKRKRNEFILAYNRALILYNKGESTKCVELCAEKLNTMIQAKQKPSDELAAPASRMAFLLLECVLALSIGRLSGLLYESLGIPPLRDVVVWLDLLDTEKDPQLKFLLSLYKSRLNLAELDENGKHSDTNIRSAKKELKSAMEVLQHKLRSSFSDTASVVSSANSEENMSTATPQEQHHHQQQQLPTSLVLQKLNQSALTLKAHLEQLKGNTKKSLILCSEAVISTTENPCYEAVHSNNLGVVYGTNGKSQLALHAMAKGLQTSTATSDFHPDGTARPSQMLMILYNASICALHAGNYLSAYECMATCVSESDMFWSRPRCWLRMAEACVGIYSRSKPESDGIGFSTVEVDGEAKGLLFDQNLFTDRPEIIREELVSAVGSPEDLDQVKRSPLLRARACLEHTLKHEDDLRVDARNSARLTMCYVCLCFHDYKRALEIAKAVLDSYKPKDDADEVSHTVYKRRMATARMYAAEASCALGQAVDAMKFLVGDGQDDAFDRLASDLGGVTMQTAATNGKGKRRLARAQTTVRSSASAVTASMGNDQAAKQLAMSAQAMEDAYATNRERSSARRALIYSLLRRGNHSAALTLLKAMR